MNKIRVMMLVGAAALLLSGCYGYGTHMYSGNRGDHMYGDDYDRHMGREDIRSYPAAPCDPDQRDQRNQTERPPCRSNQ